jgi:hypothetical protein
MEIKVATDAEAGKETELEKSLEIQARNLKERGLQLDVREVNAVHHAQLYDS